MTRALVAIVSRLLETEYLSIYLIDPSTGKLQMPCARNFSETERIEALREELRRLASPMIEVGRGILAVPLIGMMNAERFTLVAEKVLPVVVEKRVRAVIIDLTGIEIMDTDAVTQLVRLRSAISLLGCRCIVSGIRFEIAKQMMELGGDFDMGATFRTLSQALGFVARKAA